MAIDLPGVNVKLTIPGNTNPKGWQELPRDSDGVGYELAVQIPGTNTLVRLHPHAVENQNVCISYGMLRVPSYVSKAWAALDNAPVYCRPIKERLPGGRPPSATWEDYRVAFIERCKNDGWPDPLNDDGWQTQADVIRWLQPLIDRENRPEGKEPDPRTIRRHVRKWMLDKTPTE